MKRLSGAAYYLAQALTVAALLFVSLQLWQKDLHVPFGIEGDSLFWTVIVEAVYEDGWGSRVSRLGMPVGADIMDWPMGMPLDFTLMSLLRALLGTPGAALNTYWLLSMVATGLGATLCLRWLAITPSLAFALGTLYALLPYAFGHSTGHIPLVFHFIPLIAFLALRLGEGDPQGLSRGQRLAALAACLLQGLSYIYYSFFSILLLIAAAAIGWARTRQARMIRTAVVAVALLCGGTLAGLTPSLRYWQAHGRNPELSYKTVAEADTFGLRIRHLLTPIPDHPIPVFRRAAEAVKDAGFPGEGENVWARLGTVCGLGFLLLLGFSLGATAGAIARGPSLLRSAAPLTLVALLVAQVGGFGSIFNVFVTPDIRAYSRIVVFIAFFALVAAGVALSSMTGWLSSRYSWRRPLPEVGMAALLLLFSFDQTSTSHLVSLYKSSAARLEADRGFVARVESLLPPGAMVYQLRHTGVPVERVRPPMELYDHGWAFLHSRQLRWTWGGIRGRHGDWAREVAFMPPDRLVDRVARAGFAGIWVDRFGYSDRGAALVPRLATAAGSDPVESEDRRFVLISLVGLQHRLESELGAAALVRARGEALDVPLVPRWGQGCEEEDDEGRGRFCGPTARLFLKNTLDADRRVTIRALLTGPPGVPVTISAAGQADTVVLDEGEVAWERSLVLPARRRLRIDLSLPSAGPTTPRVHVLDLRVSEAM